MTGLNAMKKNIVAIALIAAFFVTTGAAFSISAQGWGRDDRRGNYEWQMREEQKGYRDGLRRGREDAETRRVPDPSNSSHYRKGTNPYREGFRRGYREGYRHNVRIFRW